MGRLYAQERKRAMTFPHQRMRRLRTHESLRRMLRETTLSSRHLIAPLFLKEGEGIEEPISSMPGQYHISVDLLDPWIDRFLEAQVGALLLFGLPSRKDSQGKEAWKKEGVVQRGIRRIKKRAPELVVITDVCLCAYTRHGHCGVVRKGRILNDETLPLLSKMAISHAQAGADMVAPSDMMDGRIHAIRSQLDGQGHTDVGILSYAVKYASSFYGPFREAAQSSPSFGDRKTYQMDPANLREALEEARLDLEEGADILMVKPALAYLDVIREVKNAFQRPLAAYCVSGEYAMVKAAAEKGWMDERSVVMEILTALRRAGADLIVTYWSLEVAKWLKQESN